MQAIDPVIPAVTAVDLIKIKKKTNRRETAFCVIIYIYAAFVRTSEVFSN